MAFPSAATEEAAAAAAGGLGLTGSVYSEREFTPKNRSPCPTSLAIFERGRFLH